jgi:carboxyl-terminal processing protease
MLQTLDPHSSFFEPREYAQMRERQQGSYYGLGIQIQSLDGDITVMSVFENSPAYRKGLRRGDIIARSRRRCQTSCEGLDEPTRPSAC